MTRRGFTLLEMTTVIFVIALLILLIVPNITHQRQRAMTVNTAALVTVVQNQEDAYCEDAHVDSADFAILEKHGYLTAQQVRQSNDAHLHIVSGKVHRD